MRPTPSLSVAYTGLWAICLSCLMLLDCVLLCEALRSYLMQQFKGCDLMHVLLWLVSVPLCAPLTAAGASQPL